MLAYVKITNANTVSDKDLKYRWFLGEQFATTHTMHNAYLLLHVVVGEGRGGGGGGGEGGGGGGPREESHMQSLYMYLAF